MRQTPHLSATKERLHEKKMVDIDSINERGGTTKKFTA